MLRGARLGASRAVLCVAVAALLAPTAAAAQLDTTSLHATVRGWADRTWLYLLDRSGIPAGRLGDQGFLQRFHQDIEAEDELDLVSSRFGLVDDYRWQQQPNGFRYWGGSITYVQLRTGLEMKAAVPLGSGWSTAVHVVGEDGPNVQRRALAVRFRRDWSRGPYVLMEGHLYQRKAEMDVAVGVGLRNANGDARITLTAVDAFSDAIYQGLVVWHGFADTALNQGGLPLALRGQVQQVVAGRVRLELDAGVLLPSSIEAYRQLDPDVGFAQEERFAMLAGLAEISPHPRVRVGGFARIVRAVTDRRPLPASGPLDDYRLTERTSSIGVYGLVRAGARWRVEWWSAREWRPERRAYRPANPSDVDYEDRSWNGQLAIHLAGWRGAQALTALEWDLREFVRGEGDVPSYTPLGNHNIRWRIDLGWRLNARAEIYAGTGLDLDGDAYLSDWHKWFDGAHARFALYW